jgi:hypothetical protein
MKKWLGLLISILLIVILLSVPFAFDMFNPAANKEAGMKGYGMVVTQDREKEPKGDTYSAALLKQIREKVDAWLKELNEKIEREDITRFEVRFYEILRNILEWVREKIDAEIESPEEKRQKMEKKEGVFRETREGVFPFLDIG